MRLFAFAFVFVFVFAFVFVFVFIIYLVATSRSLNPYSFFYSSTSSQYRDHRDRIHLRRLLPLLLGPTNRILAIESVVVVFDCLFRPLRLNIAILKFRLRIHAIDLPIYQRTVEVRSIRINQSILIGRQIRHCKDGIYVQHTLCTASQTVRNSFQCSTLGVAVVVCSVRIAIYFDVSTQE